MAKNSPDEGKSTKMVEKQVDPSFNNLKEYRAKRQFSETPEPMADTVETPAMGGLEAVKWMVRYISCRKTDARKEEADVSSLEEENRRKKVDWLEDRLAQRDEKIDGLYIELRKEQEEKIDWIHKCHEVELAQKESEVKKCEIRGCVKRIPPSEY